MTRLLDLADHNPGAGEVLSRLRLAEWRLTGLEVEVDVRPV